MLLFLPTMVNFLMHLKQLVFHRRNLTLVQPFPFLFSFHFRPCKQVWMGHARHVQLNSILREGKRPFPNYKRATKSGGERNLKWALEAHGSNCFMPYVYREVKGF